MEHIQPDRLADRDLAVVRRHPRRDHRLDPAGEKPPGGGEPSLGGVEPIDERGAVGVAGAERRGGLADEAHGLCDVGQEFDVALRRDDHGGGADEIGPGNRQLPTDDVGRRVELPGGLDLDHRVSGERLQKGNREASGLAADPRGIDDSGGADFGEAPRLVETEHEAADRGAPHGHAEAGLDRDPCRRHRIAILGFDHDPAPQRTDPQGQRGRLGVVGERRGQPRLPLVGRRIDAADPGHVVPGRLPVPLDHQADAAPLSPGFDAGHGEAEWIQRRPAGRINRPLALQFDTGRSVWARIDHHRDGRAFGFTSRGDLVFRERAVAGHTPQRGIRGQANWEAPGVRREI